jgi:ethanolamine utilization protein EutA (predicted chaperonin)
MVRTQIQLPEKQVAILKSIAASQNISMAEIIRQSIDYFVKSKHSEKTMQQRHRAIAAAGKFRSGVHDLASAHDAYLAKIVGK